MASKAQNMQARFPKGTFARIAAILDTAGDLPQNARNLAPRIALERRIVRSHRQLEHCVSGTGSR